MRYVYPVISRRAQGVSIGINLNPNNACNWRCVYCQVPDLRRGAGPTVDLALLEDELSSLLDAVVRGDFMETHVPEEARVLKDIAFSGDGESTSSPQFLESLEKVADLLDRFGLRGKINVVLITNGSLVQKPGVQKGLQVLSDLGGEVWFKLDRGSSAAIKEVNGAAIDIDHHLVNLETSARCVSTWIQTCMFAKDGRPPTEKEVDDYLCILGNLLHAEVPVRGVLLYGMARPPMLPEGKRLSQLESAWLEDLGERIRALSLRVRVSA